MNSRFVLTLAVSTLSLMARTALADGTSDIEGILDQPIVVTASKTPEAESVAPGTATVLTSDDLRRYGIHTIAEAIDFLSLGLATSTGPQGAEVGARGVLLTGDNNDHVLLLVNGHTVNEPLTGGARFDRAAGIPIEIVDHIEVILGPGSVLYGTGAMLGVVNVVTKSASAFHGSHVVAEATPSAWGRVGAGAGYDFNLFGKKSEFTAAVEYFDKTGPDLTYPLHPFDNGQPTWGGTNHSNRAEVSSALVRFTSGNLDISLRGSVSRTVGLNPAFWFDNPLNRTVERWGSVDLVYNIPVSARVELTARAYADAAEQQFHQVTGLFNGCFSGFCDFTAPGVAHGGGVDVRSSIDWLGTGELVTLIGVEARLRFVAYKFDHLNPINGQPLESTSSNFSSTDVPVGPYAQQTWQPASWLAFNGGLRFDADPRFTGVFSPRIAATVKPWEGGVLKATYAQAFRAPSWQETNASSQVQPIATDLFPETVRMYELSFEQAFGAQRLRFGGFIYEWNDLVALYRYTDSEIRAVVATGMLGDIPFSPGLLSQYRNIQALHEYGYNLGYDGSQFHGALRYALNATAAIARDTSGRALVVAPRLFGNARVSYDFGGPLPSVALAARVQGRRLVDVAYSGGFMPAPYAPPVLDLRGTVVGAVPLVDGLSYRATADYAFASVEPYGVGPVHSSADSSQPDFLPNPSGAFTLTLGLQYDFF